MKIESIIPTAAVALADRARSMELMGKQILKLQTGDPDFNTHDCIKLALERAIKKNQTHYSFSQGLPELRKIISQELNCRGEFLVNEKQVIITHGAVQGFESIIAALIDYEDEAIILEPNWPTIDSLVKMMGGVPVKIDFLNNSENLISKLESAYTTKTKLITFNFPNNPTGLLLQRDELFAICNWAKSKNIYIVADEVYGFLQFSNQIISTIELLGSYEKYIYVDSFSKKYAMTGWRIGYVVSSNITVEKIAKASQITITNVAPFIQIAAIEALSNPESKKYSNWMRNQYQERCELLIMECKNLGLEFIKPEGAFYLFIKLPQHVCDIIFCEQLLNEYNICVVPGSAFGKAGQGYLRISYANATEIVLKALGIISTVINKNI